MAIARTISHPLEISRHGLPNICGWEREIASIVNHERSIFLPSSNINLDKIKAGFACALHMHQPTIPAGANGELISNLQYMLEHQGEGDNHNASVFAWCYSRMGDWIPELVHNGCNPRIMLDYSALLVISAFSLTKASYLA